jgi:hypothetical protein
LRLFRGNTGIGVEEQSAYFVMRDHNGQQLAYVYFEDEPGRRPTAKLLSKDEARRIAANIAKLLIQCIAMIVTAVAHTGLAPAENALAGQFGIPQLRSHV